MQILNQDMEFFEENRSCSYFDNEKSDMRYQFLNSCSIENYRDKLIRGWRRFGKIHFVPECKSCTKCVSMRIDVKNYKFSKSEKRVLNKNKNTKIAIRTPEVTLEHLELYDKYHSFMNRKKNWPYYKIAIDEYIKSYVEGNSLYAKEFLYIKDDKLIGVAFVDVLPDAISSIYCFYDHDYEDLSIGKFSILFQIQVAKELDIPYIYLGYWIKDHFSMGYKESYSPFEILENRPSLEEEPIWKEYK
ncbi:arginyltransferase [Arcobacter porcinus]|uniref:Aspartate/glutamate leucyltransferase n=1 Tax=Arcobacter porcinus TaxID=1935204 RepID=A0ABX2YBD3_9BACT|nr:arginyltransferase [Arcobacter porcinus]OCL81974.1 arginyl-tRNA-protein transferase [Arcobacter porcinus]OCL82050.1 arginyl-tRNA-protein transferase [Arcobacter porcinus]OCL86179.1 arginyl-tRNA-protein transferase [Arcobacter porcinus]OCL90318.1 arginyl-tRNA-protein transferase [Arcobacter porcinus]